MAYFFCKFITPRKDFLKTMSADEAKLLKAHGEYLQELLEHGRVVAHGPVVEPQGGFGLSLFDVEDENELSELTAQDPMILAGVGARYDTFPMIQLRYRGNLGDSMLCGTLTRADSHERIRFFEARRPL